MASYSDGSSNAPLFSRTSSDTEKYIAAVSPEEVQWLTDIGLGRGIDNTKHNPWKYKSSFQVRTISESLDDIIGTDSGGVRKYFEKEILSTRSRQMNHKFSAAEPHATIQMSVDAVYSRGGAKSTIAVGEEIATRTISFRQGFHDLPLIKKSTENTDSETVTDPDIPVTCTPFEEKLSDWLLHQIHTRDKVSKFVEEPGALSSTAKLSRYLHENPKDDGQIIKDCLLFVEKTGVTHYVHSILLGAKRFRILTSSEYNSKVGVKAGVSAALVAKTSVSASSSWWQRKSSMDVEEMGKMVDGHVKRGIGGGEAVIGFQIVPIYTLVRSHHVREVLMKSLTEYYKTQGENKSSKYTHTLV